MIDVEDLPPETMLSALRKGVNLLVMALEQTPGGMDTLKRLTEETPEGRELAQLAALLGVEE